VNNYVIFDRDGTLIDLKPYLSNINDLNITDCTINGLNLLKKHGFRFGIITNQSVIGRGIATALQVESVNDKMIQLFRDQGIYFDFLYYCPHHPIDKCNCRKPKIQLGIDAINKHQINVAKSYMIGDMETDIQFGNSLKLKTGKIGLKHSDIADFNARNIYDAAKWIVNQK